MKAVRYLIAFLILVAVWVAFIQGSLWIWPRLGDYADSQKGIALVIPILVLVGFSIGWMERFFSLRGRLIGAIGNVLLIVMSGSGFARSLVKLRDWHDAAEVGAEYQDYIRNLSADDREAFRRKNPFSRWMVAEVVRKYENNVQGFAYLGAGILILFIGLRGLQIIGKSDPLFIILPLEIEFTIIGLLGLLIFYKPEENSNITVSLPDAMPTAEIKDLTTEVRLVREELSGDRSVEVRITRTKE